MVLNIAFLFFYGLNLSILFQGQSLILLFAFWILCLFITKLYVQLTSSTFQIEIIEWIENLQFLLLLKTWYMLSIRLLNIQLYNFYTFLSLLVYELNAIMGEFFSVLHSLYMNQIQFNAFCNLGRLYLKKKSIKTQLFDSRYFMSV
jgi:hypothetical protein